MNETGANISDKFVNEVCQRLAANKPVRRKLPRRGRIHIDRMLPFVCVYRKPPDDADLGTENLILGEASYISSTSEDSIQESLTNLLESLSALAIEQFGAFLIVEIWPTPNQQRIIEEKTGTYKSVFRIFEDKAHDLPNCLRSFEQALRRVSLMGQRADIEIITDRKISPVSVNPLIEPASIDDRNLHLLGIEVAPVYLDPNDLSLFPMVLKEFHRAFSAALKRLFFSFTRQKTSHYPPHYHFSGRRTMVKPVWEADAKLSSLDRKFDLLLNVTPVNSDSAWLEFKRTRFQNPPHFAYRPLLFDPSLLKRELFNIRLERLEDPVLTDLFLEKQSELDRQISLLQDLNTPQFICSSLQLFGDVETKLKVMANQILDKTSNLSSSRITAPSIDAAKFAQLANAEIESYRNKYAKFNARVEIREDVSGLLVSRGELFVGTMVRIPEYRLQAAIQHEVGTHLLTYYNAMAQPFHQLHTGFAGYEELQEGLAVLSEYLVGGLNAARLRTLALRVTAVDYLIQGANFVEIFRQLSQQHGVMPRLAFTITMRVTRGGGFTKDIVYLRGLMQLLKYLRDGGELELLYVGKIGVQHVPVIKEFQWRQILTPPPLIPNYLQHPKAQQKIDNLSRGHGFDVILQEGCSL